MPDSRTQRGLHPQDITLFAPSAMPALCTAVQELAWLLTRGYALPSSLKLVGDRHDLRQRQRELVTRAVCSDAQQTHRMATRITAEATAGQEVWIDGFNLLITVEAALSGGLVYAGRDGALRDLSSVHGSYRTIASTAVALEAIGETLQSLGPAAVTWCFDQPVSNSGKLASMVRGLATKHDWPWEVVLAMNPDRELIARRDFVLVTSDGVILDAATRWLPLSELVLQRKFPNFRWLDCGRTALQ